MQTNNNKQDKEHEAQKDNEHTEPVTHELSDKQLENITGGFDSTKCTSGYEYFFLTNSCIPKES